MTLTEDARRPPGGPALALQVALVYLGGALIAAGLLIMFTDQATGVVRVPADCSELGWLTLTVTGLALILRCMATGLVKRTGLGSASPAQAHQPVNRHASFA